MSMRRVLIDLRRDNVAGSVPAKGHVQCVPTRRRDDPITDAIRLPAGFTAPLVDGQVEVLLEPTGPDWCWQVFERVSAGIVRHVLVPEGDPELVLAYRDLVDVDPATLEPAESAVPAWDAAVSTVRDYASDAASSMTLARGHADDAENWSLAAQRTALTVEDARTAAEDFALDAETAASAASGSAGAAAQSATFADASKTEAEAAAAEAEQFRDQTEEISGLTGEDEAVALLLRDEESRTRAALEAPGAVGFQPIAVAPTYIAQRLILGVVDGALYSTPTAASSRIDRLDGDTWTPVATASGAGPMIRIYGMGDGEILVNRSQSMLKSAGWGTPDVTFSQVVEVRPPGDADRSEVRFHQGWGVDVRGQYVIATEYGAWGISRYVWLSSDNGSTFQRVFDFHDHPGGSTPNLGGAHLHGVAINLRDQTIFVVGGDAAAAAIYWAELSTPTQWFPLAHQPTSSMGHKAIPTTIRETRWGMTLGSDNDPNGVWHIPHSSDHDYRMSFHLVFPFGRPSTQVVAQHIHEDEWGVAWHLFTGVGDQPHCIVAFSGPGAYSVVLEDQNKRIFGTDTPRTIFAHASRLWVTVGGGGVYVFARPRAGTPAPVVRDSGATLGGTANPDGSAVAAGINAKAPGLGSVAVGAAEATEQDAVAIGKGTNAPNHHSVAVGPTAKTDRPSAVAVGSGSTASGVAVGPNALSAFISSIALGSNARSEASNGVVVGYHATAPAGNSATAIGAYSSALGNGTAVGRGAEASYNDVGIGHEAKASAGGSVAIGRQAEATHLNSVAIGHQTKATGAHQVHFGPRHLELDSVAGPSAPVDGARIYVVVSDGKHRLVVRFPSGALIPIAQEA